MVIWRTTARTGCALGARTLSSSPLVKAQAIDFSKAVEDFKTNGVAILPLKMETGDLMLLDFTTKTLAQMGSNCKRLLGIHSSYYEPSDYNLIPIKCDYLILAKVTTKSNIYCPIISFHLFMLSDRKKKSEKFTSQVFPSHETWRNLPRGLKQEFCDIPAGNNANRKVENDEPRLPPLFEALRKMPTEKRQVLPGQRRARVFIYPGIQICSGTHRLGFNPGCATCRNH